MVATMVRSGSYSTRRSTSQSERAAIKPTRSGASSSAAMKPRAGDAPTACVTHQAKTAPSMKNSPCATFTTRITPNTSERPSAVSVSTEA